MFRSLHRMTQVLKKRASELPRGLISLVTARPRSATSDLVIRKFLDLSTVHLSEETCRDLNIYEGLIAYDTEYGWLVYAAADPDERTEDGDWPAELRPIVALARANGCDYILFDADAETTGLLPTFTW